MTVTITGNKYTGSTTAAGTNTLIDTAATFSSAHFLEDNQRIVELFSSGGVWKGVAWIDKWTSATVLQLMDVFRDIDGNTVIQAIGDVYYVSKNFADVVSAAKTTTGDLIEFSQELVFGDTTATGVCFYDQNKAVRIDAPGVGATFAVTVLGGLTTFGRVLDWVKYRTTSGCSILVSGGTGVGDGLRINDPDARFIYAGSNFINLNHDGCRFGGKDGQAGLFFIAMNCSTNANIASPGPGDSWGSGAADHRIINMNYWGTGTVGTGSGVGIRWGDGVLIGGTYGFGVSDNSVSMFGSTTIAFVPEIGAGAGSRLVVNNIFTSDIKTTLYRTGSNGETAVVNFTNVLTDNRKAGYGNSPGSNANNSVDMYFFFREDYTGLVENTDAYIYDVTQASLSAATVISASGVFAATIQQQSVSGFTANSTSTSWRVSFVKYGYLLSISAFSASTVSVGRGSATDVVFGGPVVQALDLLITEPVKATVDAYSTIDDSFQLYDRASSWFEDNYDAEQALYIGRSGGQITLSSVALFIDSSAGSAFTYSTGIITVKSTTFTGGATGTGLVTLANGVELNGGTFDNVSGGETITTADDDGTTHTDTTITKYRHTGAGTYAVTFSGSAPSEIEVTGGATLAVTLTNGANIPALTQTSGTITLVQNVTATFGSILDGTRVQLYNVTKAAEIEVAVVSGGSGYIATLDLQSAAVDSGDTLEARFAYYDTSGGNIYNDLARSFTITTSNFSDGTAQTVNSILSAIHALGGPFHGPNVTGFALDVANIEIDSAVVSIDGQKLATWLAYQISSTNDGIRNYFDSIDAINVRNFRFKKAIQVDNTGAPAIWTGAAWTRTDGLTVVAPTSNTIQFSNALISFSVANTAQEVRDAIGMAAANLDTQLGAIPTAVENRVEMDDNSTKLAQTRALAGLIPAAL